MGRTGYEGKAAEAVKKRGRLAAVLILLVIPVTMVACSLIFQQTNYMMASLLVIVYTMIPFFMVFEKRKPKAREIVLIAMMTAVTVCVHMVFHITLPIQIGTALVIISGIAMGPEAGFLVGALARFVCNFYMGQGQWTPWQMFAWGLMGFLAGLIFAQKKSAETKHTDPTKSIVLNSIMGPVLMVLFAEIIAYITILISPGEDSTFAGWRIYAFGAAGLIIGGIFGRKSLKADKYTVTVFTFLTIFMIYGGIMNVATMFTSMGIPGGMELSLNTLRLLFISGLPMDFSHAATASICIFIMGEPMIKKIERIKIKYGIYR